MRRPGVGAPGGDSTRGAGAGEPEAIEAMTVINKIMELAQPMQAERYRRYLAKLPEFELAEKLRILEEQKGMVSQGWRPAGGGRVDLHLLVARVKKPRAVGKVIKDIWSGFEI